MPGEESKVDKAIDDFSGSTNHNERVWAVASAGTALFFTGGNPAAAFVAARVGSAVGHGAQELEKKITRWFK